MMNAITRSTRLGLLTVLTACLAACDSHGPTAPTDAGTDGAPVASRVQGPRPLLGSLSGSALAGDPCSVTPPGVLVTATGHGTVTHLGTTTLVQTACLSVPDFLPLGPSVATLTGANGDRLVGLVTGLTFTPDGLDMDSTITGGSGRFEEAAGQYRVYVVQSAPL